MSGGYRRSFNNDSPAPETEILGGTDQTRIGNVGDRLKVNSRISGVLADNVIHIPAYLQNGSSSDMSVNGSGTPVQFTWAPTSSEIWYLQTIEMLLIDPGTMDDDDFGSINQLTNGLLIEIRSNGVTYTFGNFQNNMDLSLLFGGGGGNSNSGILFDTSGFLDNNDIFRGAKGFNPPIILDAAQGDFVRATVRDNLTGLQRLRMTINKYRVV